MEDHAVTNLITWSRSETALRPLTESRLILLYRGGPDAQPCYRLHLAAAIVRRLEPKTADELVARVLPACAPAHAIETLLVAYREWKERQREPRAARQQPRPVFARRQGSRAQAGFEPARRPAENTAKSLRTQANACHKRLLEAMFAVFGSTMRCERDGTQVRARTHAAGSTSRHGREGEAGAFKPRASFDALSTPKIAC